MYFKATVLFYDKKQDSFNEKRGELSMGFFLTYNLQIQCTPEFDGAIG
jgi:hypothetical protein